MNTINKAVLTEAVKVYDETGSLKKVRGFLAYKDVPEKLIKELIEKNQWASKRAGGFASTYYAWLAEAPRTRDEAAQYISGEGDYEETSANVKNHLKHYLNIADLAIAVRNAK